MTSSAVPAAGGIWKPHPWRPSRVFHGDMLVCLEPAPHLGTARGIPSSSVEVLKTAKIGGAAQYCDDLEYGDYTDWFLPSNDELNLMYQNLKEKGLGGFISDTYWSSSVRDNSVGYSFAQRFNDGFRFFVDDNNYNRQSDKSRSNRVRAVRQF
jgi:hypothetical protein